MTTLKNLHPTLFHNLVLLALLLALMEAKMLVLNMYLEHYSL
jgi:hypothetical protein